MINGNVPSFLYSKIKLIGLVFLLLGVLNSCIPVALPPLKPLPELDRTGQKNLIRQWEQSGPPLHKSEVPLTPMPAKANLIPEVGKQNIYGITITPELKLAYETFLGGDGEEALKALKKAEVRSGDPGMMWQLSFLKAQVLIMMGRAADAEIELETTARREIAFVGYNLNARALRGEIKLWLEDYDGAKRDMLQVVQATGSWSMPTSYTLPPSNLPQLAGVTTAQLRAFTALAGIYVFEEDYEKALRWGQEAEKKFNDVHYITSHQLYGRFIVGHVDSYYGRAMNLVFLACAKMAVTKNIEEGNKIFTQASDFLRMLEYKQGMVTLEALKARTLLVMGRYESSLETARKTLEMARQYGLTDLIWRIQVMAGAVLFRMDREQEAEASLRQAQTSIDLISGTLVTDRAKIRFGVGKEDVGYLLAKINLKKNDYARLFEDLERSRARAFVDMLAGRKIAQNREPELIDSIQKLNQQILRQRLINMAPVDSPHKSMTKERELLAQRRAIIEQLRQKDPELADVLSISSKSLQQVQAALKTGEVLVYPIPARSHEPVQLFFIESQNQRIATLPLTWKDLQARLDQFSQSIGLLTPDSMKRGLAVKKTSPSDPPTVPTEIILRDLTERLQLHQWPASKAIYVVPSGSFFFIPWGALDIKTPIVALPNGGWLIRHPYPFVPQHQASVVGDPEFGGLLPQLPGARSEAEGIASYYQKAPLLGEKATEERLRDSIGSGVKILHLATHGIFNSQDPLASALFLTRNGKAFPLTAQDLYEKPLPAQFVVLSACETGMGHITSGDDLLGLVRSFYLSGTLAILSSLWPVDDEGTKLFMELFHQHIQKDSYGEAWLFARNALKAQGFPPSVYGAYILGGHSR